MTVPHQWHVARIAAILNECDMGDYSNGMTISIMVVAYKNLARIILPRLKSGSAEQRVLQNELHFISKARTISALILARRAINHAIKHKAPSHRIARN